MESASSLITHRTFILTPFRGFKSCESTNSIHFLKPCNCNSATLTNQSKATHLAALCFRDSEKSASDTQFGSRSSEVETSSQVLIADNLDQNKWKVEVGNPSLANLPLAKLSLSDQAFFLLAFIACTTCVSFTSLVIAAVPTLYAMRRAAISLSKLAETARDELPSTMAAIRLSGMEISDLTLELSDLSQEIADGVNKSTQAVQAAEAGIRQIGSLARQQTISLIQERASLPVISLKPVVAGAAKKTSHAVGKATRSLMSMISRGELSSVEDEDDSGIDRVEI